MYETQLYNCHSHNQSINDKRQRFHSLLWTMTYVEVLYATTDFYSNVPASDYDIMYKYGSCLISPVKVYLMNFSSRLYQCINSYWVIKYPGEFTHLKNNVSVECNENTYNTLHTFWILFPWFRDIWCRQGTGFRLLIPWFRDVWYRQGTGFRFLAYLFVQIFSCIFNLATREG